MSAAPEMPVLHAAAPAPVRGNASATVASAELQPPAPTLTHGGSSTPHPTQDSSEAPATPLPTLASLAPARTAPVASGHSQPSAAAAAAAPAPAGATKSLAALPSSLSSSATSHKSPAGQALRDGGDNRGKRGSLPSSAPIGSGPSPTPMQIALRTQSSQLDQASPPPSLSDRGHSIPVDIATSTSIPAAMDSSPPPSLAHPAVQHQVARTPVQGNLQASAPSSSMSLAPPEAAASSASSPSSASVGPSVIAGRITQLSARLDAARQLRITTKSTDASHVDSHQQRPVTAALDWSPTCHCLVVDVDHVAPNSSDLAHLIAALALKGNTAALRQHLLTWLSLLVSTNLTSVDAEAGHRRVHVRFSSEVDLAAALASSPLLSRCGSISNKSWGGPAMLCGLERHRLPELLRFSCSLSDKCDPAQLLPTIDALLIQHGLLHTNFWLPNSNNSDRQHGARVVFHVLPRLVSPADLSATIERLHLQCTLWGSKLHVEAPNTPALSRCRTCNGLGHAAERCPLYSGLCARLLFKKPLPHAALLTLVTHLGARGGYLASSVDTRTQHRKVTVLFDGGVDMELSTLAPIISKLDQFDAVHGHLLHEKISFVEPSNRLKECRECNQLQRVAHTCPFPEAAAPGRQHAQQRASNNSSNHPRPPPSSHLSSSLADPSDKMCRGWRRKKECQRKTDGRHCSFEHPPEHVPVKQPCFTLQRKGYCNKGSECKWDHSIQGAEQQEAAAQDQPAPAAPAPAAAALPAVPVPAPAARTSRRRTPSSREEKGDDMSDFDLPAASASKPAAAPAAASPASAKSSNSRKGKSKGKQAAAQAAASASSFATDNSWSALGNDEEEAEREKRQDEAGEALAARKASGAGSAPPPPPSSLSLLAPPASSPKKKRRRDKEEEAENNNAPKRAQSLAFSSASAAATPAAPSRSSTSAGPLTGQ